MATHTFFRDQDQSDAVVCHCDASSFLLNAEIDISVPLNEHELLKKYGDWFKGWYFMVISEEKEYWRSYNVRLGAYAVRDSEAFFTIKLVKICNDISISREKKLFKISLPLPASALIPQWVGFSTYLKKRNVRTLPSSSS